MTLAQNAKKWSFFDLKWISASKVGGWSLFDRKKRVTFVVGVRFSFMAIVSEPASPESIKMNVHKEEKIFSQILFTSFHA